MLELLLTSRQIPTGRVSEMGSLLLHKSAFQALLQGNTYRGTYMYH
jgi:hypothetical protein